MSGYGAINVSHADGSEPTQIENGSSHRQTNKFSIKELLSRPWARAVAAFALILLVVVSSRKSGPAPVDDNAEVNDTDTDTTTTPELFYHSQLVNHFDGSKDTWANRYYSTTKYFEGPGHPIFLIIGGEGSLDPNIHDEFGTLTLCLCSHADTFFTSCCWQHHIIHFILLACISLYLYHTHII